jgi:hypothetical protein
LIFSGVQFIAGEVDDPLGLATAADDDREKILLGTSASNFYLPELGSSEPEQSEKEEPKEDHEKGYSNIFY